MQRAGEERQDRLLHRVHEQLAGLGRRPRSFEEAVADTTGRPRATVLFEVYDQVDRLQQP